MCLLPFERLGYRLRSVTGAWMAGLAALTVYAQIFSLFGGVGIGANLLLILFCLAAVLLLRKRLVEFWRLQTEGIRRVKLLILLFLILLLAYGTSRGFMHVDTGLCLLYTSNMGITVLISVEQPVLLIVLKISFGNRIAGGHIDFFHIKGVIILLQRVR